MNSKLTVKNKSINKEKHKIEIRLKLINCFLVMWKYINNFKKNKI